MVPPGNGRGPPTCSCEDLCLARWLPCCWLWGSEQLELHVLQQERQPADADLPCLPVEAGEARACWDLNRWGKWVCGAGLLPQALPARPFTALCAGCWARGGWSLGGSLGSKPQVSGGTGGGTWVPSGLSRRVSWAWAVASWGQRVRPLSPSRSPGLPVGGAPTQLRGSVSESAGRDWREASKPREAELTFPSPPLRVWKLKRLPGSSFCLFVPKLLWSKRRGKKSPASSETPWRESPCSSFLDPPSLRLESAVCFVSLATEVYVVVSVQSCLLDLIALIMARASVLSHVRGTKCLVRGPWYCPEPPALVVVDVGPEQSPGPGYF